MRRANLFFIILFSLLAACTGGAPDATATAAPTAIPATATAPRPSDTISPSNTPAPTVLFSPIPPTATDTVTPEPTATPLPQIVWVNPEKVVALFDSFGVLWSPSRNEFIFETYPLKEEEPAFLASAPAFEPITITNIFTWEDHFTWSFNGDAIIFHSIPPGSDDPWNRQLWRIDRDNKNVTLLDSEYVSTSWLWFRGWLDPQTIVYSQYTGGGHVVVSAVNIETGENPNIYAIVHGYAYSPQNGYIPLTSDTGEFDPRVMVLSDTFLENQNFQRAEGNFRLIPAYRSYPVEQSISLFEDWYKDSNQMLVYWGYFDGEYPSPENEKPTDTDLLLWDVGTDKVKTIALDGVGGRFSGDGQYLAYLSIGPTQLNAQNQPVKRNTQTQNSVSTYLQLLNMNTRQVVLSVPTLTRWDIEELAIGVHNFLRVGFSPDSRYLAFLTPGVIITDSLGRSTQVITDSAQAYLNLLDLQSQQLLWSSPTTSETETAWSPMGNFLVYQGADQNWYVLDANNPKLISLTLANGQYLSEPAWSFDERYLSLASCISFAESQCHRTTHILDITQGIVPNSPITLTALRMDDELHGCGVETNGHTLCTDNGGQTWHVDTSRSADELLAASATTEVEWLNDSIGWRLVEGSAGAYALEKTTDGGITWGQIKSVTWSGQLDFVSEQIGWAIARQGQAVALVHTTDGGRTWTEIKPIIIP